jgi:hypothetical protein
VIGGERATSSHCFWTDVVRRLDRIARHAGLSTTALANLFLDAAVNHVWREAEPRRGRRVAGRVNQSRGERSTPRGWSVHRATTDRFSRSGASRWIPRTTVV